MPSSFRTKHRRRERQGSSATVDAMTNAFADELEVTADLCHDVGLAMLSTSGVPNREPGIALKDVDEQLRSTGLLESPLSLAHELASAYLADAGDCVYAIGQLMSPAAHMNVAPGVLARSAAEYAARAWYLMDPADTSLRRVAKACEFLNSAAAAHTGQSTAPAKELQSSIQLVWRQLLARGQPRVKGASNFSNLVAAMDPERGQRVYSHLSNLVHANALTVLIHHYRRHDGSDHSLEVINQAQFAASCGLLAAIQLASLREDPGLRELLSLAENSVPGDRFKE